jgi:hypothetical protein
MASKPRPQEEGGDRYNVGKRREGLNSVTKNTKTIFRQRNNVTSYGLSGLSNA